MTVVIIVVVIIFLIIIIIFSTNARKERSYEEAKTTPKEPFPEFSLRTRWALFALIVFIAACAHPMIWSACFKKPLEKNPAAYAEIVKKIPKEMRN